MWKRFLFSNTEKPTEKAFSQSLLISVISILLCLVALCSMTYAWFNESVSSGSNSIKAGTCEVTITVISKEGQTYTFIPENSKPKFASGTYTVTIGAKGTASSAYCVLRIGGKDYYTEQVAMNETISFDITFGKDTTVEFIPRWGKYHVVERDLENNGEYSFPAQAGK